MYLIEEQIETLYTLIQEHDVIILHRHVRPDPDAFGSQLGFKALLEHAFPNKQIFAAGTMTKGLSWMGEMDIIPDEAYDNALVIVTDSANRPRIEDKRFKNGKFLVKIDHHPLIDSYGDLEIVHTEASSVSEMIAEVSYYLADRLPMTVEAAKLLYAGIVGDTNRFLYDSTSPITLRAAARLVDLGIDTYGINDHFNTLTLNQAKFQGFALDELEILANGVAHLTIRRSDLVKYDITEEESNSIVTLPGTIEGVQAWVIFIEQEGHKDYWRVRIRSKGPIINFLAENYQGGGHPKASGAKVYSLADKERLLNELSELTEEYLGLVE